jgi:hypothetical protein
MGRLIVPSSPLPEQRAVPREGGRPEASRLGRALEVGYTASPRVAETLAALGRTEDVMFSRDDRRLAVVGFTANRVVVFDIEISGPSGGLRVAVTGGVELASPAFRCPHGVDFVDDQTLIVANRAGDVVFVALPPGGADLPRREATVLSTWPAGGASLLQEPGTVRVRTDAGGARHVLVCNGSSHTVSRHPLGTGAGLAAGGGEVLVRKWLDIPDGVTVSPDRRWLAVSNHDANTVFVYENTPSLNEGSDPAAILRGPAFPHSLWFSDDARLLHVADAASPYVHVFAAGEDGWRGAGRPVAAIRVLSDEQFARGRHNAQEGGAKGLAMDSASRVIALTCEHLPLAFLDAAAVREVADEGLRERPPAGAPTREQQALEFAYELVVMERHADLRAQALQAEKMRNGNSWRVTEPLRRLTAAWRRLKGSDDE